jgi:glycerol-3-phosphate dehydrogenase (NAD(P)+)
VATVAIVGAGFMGSAMAWPLSDNGHQVHLVGTHLDGEIVASCRKERWHPKLGRALPDGVEPFFVEELAQALKDVELIVQGVSSPGVRWAAETLAPYLEPTVPVLAITKGLALADDGSLCLLPDYFNSLLPRRIRGRIPLAAVGGPCIAGELAGRRPTCVVFAGREESLLQQLVSIFQTPYYHVWTSCDLEGVETCAALKNVYSAGIALASGMLEAAGGPDDAGGGMYNLAAALFAQASLEMRRLVELMGGDSRLVGALPGVGDMYVTCQGGRTVRLGSLLGSGLNLAQAVDRLAGMTLESVEAIRILAQALPRMEQAGRLSPGELPFLQHLCEIVDQGRPVHLALERFFSSPG